ANRSAYSHAVANRAKARQGRLCHLDRRRVGFARRTTRENTPDLPGRDWFYFMISTKVKPALREGLSIDSLPPRMLYFICMTELISFRPTRPKRELQQSLWKCEPQNS